MSMSQRETTVRPVKAGATCAWCRHDFATIVELLDHVDHGHLDPAPRLTVVPQAAT